MAQYIDKDALVAELEKNKNEMAPARDWYFDEYTNGYVDALKEALSIINTLEVKEVDLEKESELIANEIMIEVQANKYHTNIYNTERNDFNHSHLWLAARKGIELGLKTQK